MMYYEAPQRYVPGPGHPPRVFLAGGITGVERWHDRAIKIIGASGLDVVIFNPNRKDFPIDRPEAGWEQVSWEQRHLHLPDTLTLFWFPACDAQVTTQPIAMFELGQALGEGRPLVVGADPGYPRQADVRMLCEINRPELPVLSRLTSTVDAALAWLEYGYAGENRS
jgi:hypothetical protein